MKQRAITALVILPVFLAILLANNSYVLLASLLMISILGLQEFYNATQISEKKYRFIGQTFNLLFYVLLAVETEINILLWLIGFTLTTCVIGVFTYNKNTIRQIGLTLLSGLYITVGFYSIYSVYKISNIGSMLIWLIFIIAWGSDTVACLVGSKYGKRKITPNLSPKKSLEGFLSGIIFTTIVTSIFSVTLLKCDSFITFGNLVPVVYAFIGAIGAMVSQVGDLIASAIKRKYDIKDFGTIFPGHGGILDRFDSVIFVSLFISLLFASL